VKYNNNLFIYTLFLGIDLQVRPVGRFSRLIAQMMWTNTRVCPFGILLI